MTIPPNPPLVTALGCVTISCPEPARLVAFLREGLDWAVATQGPIDSALERLWGIAAGSAGKAHWVLHAAKSDFGMIRVVQGADRYPTRPIGTRWTGCEIVVMEDIDGLHQRLVAFPGYTHMRPPHDVDFTSVGSNIHRVFTGRAPGGTHFGFTMAVTQPKGRPFPSALTPVGHIFAAHLVSSDYAKSHAFYSDGLGMVQYFKAHMTEGGWHTSWKLPAGTPVDLGLFRGDGPNSAAVGSLEMQGYDNVHVDAVPWVRDRLDGGACIGTFTTRDIDAAFAAVRGSGVATILSEPQAVKMAPYGGGRAFCFLGPSGERVEIAERFAP